MNLALTLNGATTLEVMVCPHVLDAAEVLARGCEFRDDVDNKLLDHVT